MASVVSAGEQLLDEPVNGVQVTFSTPDTYAACPTTATSNQISTSGVPSDWRLVGVVIVRAVTDDGFEDITTYSIDQNGDLDLTVQYPPVANWPVFMSASTGERRAQLQIDLVLNLVTPDDFFIQEINITSGPGAGQVIPAIGPYNDWGVFCDNPPASSGLFDRLPSWLQRLIIWILRILFHIFFG
jgi:hypothetical protein